MGPELRSDLWQCELAVLAVLLLSVGVPVHQGVPPTRQDLGNL